MRPISSTLVVLAALAVACADNPVGPRGLPCARGALAYGAAVTSTLATTSCTESELGPARAYADYDVDLVQGSRYMFTVRSTDAWKPDLQLRDPATGLRITTGWATGTGEAGTSAEILYVAPQSGHFTLRVVEGDKGRGAYSLRSQSCGGSSQEIFSAQTVSAQGTIDAADCALHDRWLDADSAHAETYVVYVNRAEVKRVSLVARGASPFVGAVVIVGPFERDASGSMRAVSSSGANSYFDFTGPSDKGGTYMIAVVGRTFANLGDYALSVGPPTP